MFLAPHLLIGVVIGKFVPNIWLAFLFGIIIHFLTDMAPHSHYNVDNLKTKLNKKSIIEFLKVFIDLTVGITVCLFFIWQTDFMIYAIAGMIGSVLPDALTFIYWQTQTPLLRKLNIFHIQIIHPKKEPPFARGLISQLIVSLIAIFLLWPLNNINPSFFASLLNIFTN